MNELPVICGDSNLAAVNNTLALIVPAVILPASRLLITAPSMYVTPLSTINGDFPPVPELFTI